MNLLLLLMSTVLAHTDPALTVRDSTADIPTELIHRCSQDVMQHKDFRSVRRRILETRSTPQSEDGMLEDLLASIGQTLSEFLSWLIPTSSRPPPPPAESGPGFWDSLDFARLLTILFLAAVGGLTIWLLSWIIRRHQQDPDRNVRIAATDLTITPETPPGDLDADTYESRASSLAGQHQYSAAIRELLLGSMGWIEQQGLIRFRQGLTNRDYVRAVWRLTDQRAAFLTTGQAFELVYFGRREATQEMYVRCLTAFRGAFREQSTSDNPPG